MCGGIFMNCNIIFAEDEVIIMELAIIEATAEAAPHQSNDQSMVSCDICDKQFKG